MYWFILNFIIIQQRTKTAEKQVMVSGVDDSEHSSYALDWTLTHLFNPESSPFKLFVIYAIPFPTSVIDLAGPDPGTDDVLRIVDSDLKKNVAAVLDKAKEVCASKSVNDVTFEAIQGDAGDILCDAVERHNAAMLVVGNQGHGAIKRAVMGSVSDYCVHRAHCTVTIVKKPISKH